MLLGGVANLSRHGASPSIKLPWCFPLQYEVYSELAPSMMHVSGLGKGCLLLGSKPRLQTPAVYVLGSQVLLCTCLCVWLY